MTVVKVYFLFLNLVGFIIVESLKRLLVLDCLVRKTYNNVRGSHLLLSPSVKRMGLRQRAVTYVP
jgi:hypothetical protein